MMKQSESLKQLRLPSSLSPKKLERFQTLLQQSSGLFEYGCGGTTELASQTHSIQSITSVETNRSWAKTVSDQLPSATIIWVDVGPVDDLGNPTDSALRAAWSRVPEVWVQASQPYDLVLIDGRFRVACAALVCLYPKQVKRICFDDFTTRPQYHVILPFIDILETVESMIICRPKAGLDRVALQELYEAYKYTPA
jgi:hypothetical protein